ncbi:MAG: 50S ribosomal protein L25/general stress protein Ctc [Arenicella sp.]|nr:50S ribosomal protein L25/general stress protein Ctc [Arenicella sp.]
MSANFIVEAEVRTGSGTAASRRARRNGQVPVVAYGGGEDEQYLLVDHNKMILQLDVEAFHSALVQLHVGDDLQRAILRDVQMHPFKQQIMHLDFQRVSRKDTITMTIPLHFKGEDIAPGVKTENGVMTHNMTSLDVTCLGSDLPEYIEVDVSALSTGDSVYLSQVTLPKDVDLSASYSEDDMELPVASVLALKGPSAAALEEEEAAAEASAASASEREDASES